MSSESCALLGYTGYVGSTLLRQRPFDALYRSTNIGEIRGRTFDLVVCAAARAEVYLANQQPEADRAAIAGLCEHLRHVTARRFVLISTVNVYPQRVGVDEATPIDPAAGDAYGRHRFALERFVSEHFPGALILRLPGLYGAGLKKNFVYDLLHGRAEFINRMHPASRYQYYDMSRLWADIGRAAAAGITLLNMAVEPVTAAQIAACFGVSLAPPAAGAQPAAFDMRSMHARRLAGRDGYLYGMDECLAGIRAFRAAESPPVRLPV